MVKSKWQSMSEEEKLPYKDEMNERFKSFYTQETKAKLSSHKSRQQNQSKVLKMYSSSSSYSGTSYVTCYCGESVAIMISTIAKNPGLRFFGCKKYGHDGNCGFFEWVDMEKTVSAEKQEIYGQMNSLMVAKEDLRAFVEGVKDLNIHLKMKLDSGKRLEIQRKYDVAKEELKFIKKWGIMVVFTLFFCLIYIWNN